MEKIKMTLEDVMERVDIVEPDTSWTGTLKEAKVASVKNPLYRKGGLYIIKLDGNVVYVGVSMNLHHRLSSHYGSKSRGTALISRLSDDYGEEKAEEIRDMVRVKSYLVENTLYAEALEAYLINKYSPVYNMNSEGKSRGSGYNKKTKDPLVKHKEEIITKYSEKELSLRAIGREYGYSYNTIMQRLFEWGVPLRESKNNKNISTDDKKRAVYEYRHGGKTQKEVGETYGVSRITIYNWNKQFSDGEIKELEDTTA